MPRARKPRKSRKSRFRPVAAYLVGGPLDGQTFDYEDEADPSGRPKAMVLKLGSPLPGGGWIVHAYERRTPNSFHFDYAGRLLWRDDEGAGA